jgi:hypothetical protein
MSDEERQRQGKLPQEAVVSVREVPDEQTAVMLCDFLKAQGIEANAVAVQIPWFATVETLLHGYWGRIEVLGKDAERAAELIDEFLAAKPEETPEEEG